MHIVISAVSSARQPSGICRHAANLAKCLSAAREVSRVTLLLGDWQVTYFHDAFGMGRARVQVIPIEIQNNPYARNRWYLGVLPKLAGHLRADIVHLSFPAPVRRTFPCPVVCSLHDLYPYDAPRNFGRARVLFNRLFLRQCLAASQAVVCSSDFTLARLTASHPKFAAKRVSRIYQSVTLNPQYEQEPTHLLLRDQSFLLAVAQHRSNKNLDLLVKAFARLRHGDGNQRLKLIIVGAEGPETGTLHALVDRLNLRGQVRFTASLPDAELCWLYRRCKLLIAPSSVEGFCLPLAEALHCGTPVLCSDIPVLREIGGSACRYFTLQGNDPLAALTKGMEASLHEAASPSLSSGRFAPHEIANQHIALYSSLLAGSYLPAKDTALPRNASRNYDRFAS
jgi:glycosyltransferase involved in cell wall biosynthesis